MNISKCVFFILFLIAAEAVMAQGVEEPAKKTITGNYDSLISRATLSLSRKEFDQAEQYYRQASLLKPGDGYPIKMLEYVESSRQALEKIKMRDEDARRNAEITRLLDKGSSAIMAKNYDTARALYARVLTLKPSKSVEDFTKKKIAAIDFTLGRTPEKTGDLPGTDAVAKEEKGTLPASPAAPKSDMKLGEVAGKKIDTVTAGVAASQTKPAEQNKPVTTSTVKETVPDLKVAPQTPKSPGTAKVDAEESAEKKTTGKPHQGNYDSLISKAAVALSKKEFDQANQYYSQANLLKPGESYPIKMLEYVESSRKAFADAEMRVEDSKRNVEITRLLDKGSKAIMAKNYDTARALYAQVLTLKPSRSVEDFTRKKIAAIDFTLGRPFAKIENLPVTDAGIKEQKSTLPTSAATLENDVQQKEVAAKKIEAIDAALEASQKKTVEQNKPVTTLPVKETVPELKVAPQTSNSTNSANNTPALALSKNENTKIKTPPDVIRDSVKSVYPATKPDTLRFQKEFSQKSKETIEAELKIAQQKFQKKSSDEPAVITSAIIPVKKDKRQLNAVIDSAQAAIKNENFEKARVFFQEVIDLSSTKMEKEFAERAIKAIDEQLKNRAKPVKGNSK